MSADEVVVTGVGLITAVGLDVDDCWKAVRAGVSGIGPATFVPVEGYVSDRAAELPGGARWEPRTRPLRGQGRIDRCHAMAADAVGQAVASSGLAEAPYAAERIAVSMGTSLGGGSSGEEFHRQWIGRGLRHARPSLLRQYPLHTVADYVAAVFGFQGPRSIQSNACAAGSVAIAYGMELLRSGVADVVVAGGVDPLASLAFGGFSCLDALDPDRCAPYTRSSGLNLGEGAGIVVLERRSPALERGATILGAVGGYGLSADAYHPTAPDPTGRGATRALRAALRMDDRPVTDVDYVNGHGTGTPANDSVETWVVSHLRDGDPPPVSSTKSMIGHTLGAAGAVEAVVTILAIRDQVLPPTVVPDPAAVPTDLDIVPAVSRPGRIRAALSNSFAFGGNNAVLLLRAPDETVRACSAAGRPVVVTGASAIVGPAADSAAVEQAMVDSQPVYGTSTVEVDHYGAFPVAEIPDRHLSRGVNPQYLRRIDKFGRRAAVVAGDLMRSRGFTRDEMASTGLIFATGAGPVSTIEAFHRELISSGSGNTRLFPNTVMNAAAGHVAILNHLQGPTATICSGGISAISALHFATQLIKNGSCDRVVVLSADEASAALISGYATVPGYLSRDVCRPFGGTGTVYGGAGVAVLLEAADAAPSGRVLGRIEGFGLTGDTSGPSRLEPSGAGWARSFRLALSDAQVTSTDVDLLISAATGRPATDTVELKAVEAAGLAAVPISAPKGLFGELGASSGLLGVVQALWMGNASRAADRGFAILDDRRGPADRAVRRSLVSSFEAGGSYQSVLVSADVS
ncbi:MAG: beta-ketoacyl-[acyl-carrier-protein] synthase family protein [Micrococcales bacterium]|nr:beta-ketoacyl-[acyl-carrier-protein] synthase family protein [Micrococcales bacterium]